ncbi:threonine synthase [Oscillospiraceae bacterium HV4-5-C5C]|nr:threonine synthase [Oscillospiraceae bacterium HV4-5-C5C]
MDYISTRGDSQHYSAAQAICMGLAPDGGLFVPETIPELDRDTQLSLVGKPYPEQAAAVMSYFLTDFSRQELDDICQQAYSEDRFANPLIAPVEQLNEYNGREFMLELWHGPTAAFKDMALQLLPHLMRLSADKTGLDKEICILTATSGDTGKAALEGFKDVPGTRVMTIYPKGGVARAQELQMLTTGGANTAVVALEGSFDDAQRSVKQLFQDAAFNQELNAAGKILTSANSINWGRLLPQIAYYWSAYFQLLEREKIAEGEKLNFVVPTGNFGNILAAWYAMQMGLPVYRLVCASNQNNVLSDFLRSGSYNRNRHFYKTVTPSMDILVSSNLERLLFELTGHQGDLIAGLMKQLNESGQYEVDQSLRRRLQEIFVGGFTNDRGTRRSILEVYDTTDHVIDPHTAVGFNVYSRYQKRSRDQHVTVFVSTASPFKFAGTVCQALFNNRAEAQDDLKLLPLLAQESGLVIPEGLAGLETAEIRHHELCSQAALPETVSRLLLHPETEA